MALPDTFAVKENLHGSKMQKRKNIALIISLMALLLASGAVYYISENKSPSIDPNTFKIEDYTSIDKVILESSSGEDIALEFNGSRWRVGDSLLADRNLVDVFFATLTQAVPKRPVSGKLQDSIVNQIKSTGVKVSLYGGGQLKQEFYAGGNRQKTLAYFMDSEETPYIMEIPGYHVYVSGIFELDVNGWRDKYVFGFNWQNFLRLEATFPASPKDNFSISMIDRMVRVDNVAEQDTARLNDFLDDVSLLTAKQYLDIPMSDSLKSISPVMNIRVTDLAKREYSLVMYPPTQNNGEQLGLIQGRFPVLFDARSLRSIIKPKEYFIRR